MIRRGPFTRDRNSRPHTASEIRAHAHEDSWDSAGPEGQGQTGHTLKGCVLSCPPTRSHGLAGHRGTLSRLSPLSLMSPWDGIMGDVVLVPSLIDRYSLRCRSIDDQQSVKLLASRSNNAVFIALSAPYCSSSAVWERHGKTVAKWLAAIAAMPRKAPLVDPHPCRARGKPDPACVFRGAISLAGAALRTFFGISECVVPDAPSIASSRAAIRRCAE